MRRFSLALTVGSGLLLGVVLNACTTEDPAVTEGACEMIVDACHEKDDGSDDVINGCHSQAHDGTDAQCSTDLQACLDACNAAPAITGGHDSDHDHDTDHDHETEGDTDHDHGTSGEADTDHGDSTGGTTDGGGTSTGPGADDAADANCLELSNVCHDTDDELGQMCHDVGHDGDEAACAEIWVECIAHCVG